MRYINNNIYILIRSKSSAPLPNNNCFLCDTMEADDCINIYVQQVVGPVIPVRLPATSTVAQLRDHIELIGDTTTDQLFFIAGDDILLCYWKQLSYYGMVNDEVVYLIIKTKEEIASLDKEVLSIYC